MILEELPRYPYLSQPNLSPHLLDDLSMYMHLLTTGGFIGYHSSTFATGLSAHIQKHCITSIHPVIHVLYDSLKKRHQPPPYGVIDVTHKFTNPSIHLILTLDNESLDLRRRVEISRQSAGAKRSKIQKVKITLPRITRTLRVP